MKDTDKILRQLAEQRKRDDAAQAQRVEAANRRIRAGNAWEHFRHATPGCTQWEHEADIEWMGELPVPQEFFMWFTTRALAFGKVLADEGYRDAAAALPVHDDPARQIARDLLMAALDGKAARDRKLRNQISNNLPADVLDRVLLLLHVQFRAEVLDAPPEAKRPCYDRDHEWLRQYEAPGPTYHKPAKIRDQHNAAIPEADHVSRKTVQNGIDTARKERNG